jgi:hypothetical protein
MVPYPKHFRRGYLWTFNHHLHTKEAKEWQLKQREVADTEKWAAYTLLAQRGEENVTGSQLN